GNGRFVTVGNVGTIFTSDDGTNWTSVNSGFQNILNGVTYGNGTFVAVGSPLTEFSIILTSGDGYAWSERSPGSVQALRGAVYGNGSFLVVGDQSTILQSAGPTDFRLTANGFDATGFHLTVVGAPGSRYRLQALTYFNPSNWVDLITITNTQSAISLTDTTATMFPQRFYRLVSP